MRNVRLSIEEMAYLVGLLGGEEAAAGFLKPLLGDVDQKQLTGRLLSAAHSLIARGWLTLENGEPKSLDLSLQELILDMLQSDYSLRFSKITRGEETLVTYFFRNQRIVAHRLEHAVVCALEIVPDWETFVEQGAEFMEIPVGDEGADLGFLPADALHAARERAEKGQREEAVRLLEAAGFTAMGPLLAADLATARWRGSVLKLRPSDAALTSEEGFLVLRGQERSWLFEVIDENTLRVLSGNRHNFRTLLESMRS